MFESDTDSMYFSLNRESTNECIPEELKTSYFRDKLIWMPTEACYKHEEEYIESRSKGKPWMMEQCCLNFHSFDKRSLGSLLKLRICFLLHGLIFSCPKYLLLSLLVSQPQKFASES